MPRRLPVILAKLLGIALANIAFVASYMKVAATEPPLVPAAQPHIPGYQVVRGLVTDLSGKPMKHIDVGTRWSSVDGRMWPHNWTVSDELGRFEWMFRKEDEKFAIFARDRSGQSAGLAIVDPQKLLNATDQPALKIQLGPLVTIEGTLWADNADPYRHPNTEVSVIRDNEAFDIMTAPKSTSFRFELPAGQYALSCQGLDFQCNEFLVDATDGSDMMLRDLSPGIDPRTPLHDWRGKWIALYFWIEVDPALRQLLEFGHTWRHSDDKFQIVTVFNGTIDEQADPKEQLAKAMREWNIDIPYPLIVCDTTKRTIDQYRVKAFPSLVVIDPLGRVSPLKSLEELGSVLAGNPLPHATLFPLSLPTPAEALPKHGLETVIHRYRVFNGHENVVSHVAFLPETMRFATASVDNTLRIWELDNPDSIRTLHCTPIMKNGQYLSAFNSSAQTSLLVSVRGVGGTFYMSKDNGVTTWPIFWTGDSDFQVAQSLPSLAMGLGRMTCSRNGEILAAIVYDAAKKKSLLQIYELDRAVALEGIDVKGVNTGLRHQLDALEGNNSGESIRLTPNGALVAINKEVWDTHGGSRLWRSPQGQILCFDREGERVATGDPRGIVEIRDAKTGKELSSFTDVENQAVYAAFSTDGKYLAVSNAGNVRIWNVAESAWAATITGHQAGDIQDLTWSPDDRILITAGGSFNNRFSEVLGWDVSCLDDGAK